MSERSKRAKAASKFSLEGLAEARQKKGSRLDSLEVSELFYLYVSHNLCIQLEEEENVYDIVDEEEYEEIVAKRRAGEDFVVDDGKQ